MRKVVVTGMGVVCPSGVGINATWDNLVKGNSGLQRIEFEKFDLPCKVAGIVPRGSYSEGKFDPEEWIEPKELRRIGRFTSYALCAAEQAILQSGINSLSDEQKLKAGVYIGAGIGGLQNIYEASIYLESGNYKKMSPFFIPAALINLPSGHVSIKYGLKGPNSSVVTACATGTHAVGDSYRIIRDGEADVMVAGSAEATVDPIGIAGFSRMNALSTAFNDNPQTASRPWNKYRDGFVMGEGAGIFVLEELEHAKKRGATILAEVVGYGMSSDANHITAPCADGDGGARSMLEAMRIANISPNQIDYINAHGTSTPLGDAAEILGIKKAFGEHAYKLSVSSTKSAMGHLLGGAGSVEAFVTVKAIMESEIPPTLNLKDEERDPEIDPNIDLVPLKSKKKTINYAMSNSFGFGGTNATLIFKKYE